MTRATILTLTGCCVAVSLVYGDRKSDQKDTEQRAAIFSAAAESTGLLHGYQRWKMLTDGAVTTSETMYFACAIYSRKHYDKVRTEQGVHWSPAVRVYANDIAAKAILNGTRPFPPGSILVKEKLLDHKIDAITASIKQPNDYDESRENNDWQYAYFGQRGELQQGRVESCRECHQKAAKNDFLFLKYPDDPGYSSMFDDGPYQK